MKKCAYCHIQETRGGASGHYTFLYANVVPKYEMLAILK